MTRFVVVAACCVATVGGCRGKMVEKEAQAEPAAKVTPAPERRSQALRRLSDEELTPGLIRKAEQILDERGDDPIGTEIPFTHAGRRYVARIETHYHPVGGPERPWGEHRGVSLLTPEAEEPAPSKRR